jgi:hypothetical protein
MTHRLRPSLLNQQIAMEARRIAHAHTHTCTYQPDDLSVFSRDEYHTRKCNLLKKQIENLALHVKLAGMQPPIKIPDYDFTRRHDDERTDRTPDHPVD